jgi:Ribonuclease G/E
MIERCSSCSGKKKVVGLGSIIKDCPYCKGIGHIKCNDSIDKLSVPHRGRPKKVKDA